MVMGRGILLGRVHWAGVGWLAVGTTHLESFVGPDADEMVRAVRRESLRQAALVLEQEAAAGGCVGALLVGADSDPFLSPAWLLLIAAKLRV